MIQKDQPICFPDNLLVAVSSVDDGTVLDRAVGIHDGSVVSNRTRFCDQIGVSYGDVVYQRIIYGDERTYQLICEVDDGSTTKNTSEVVADALITRSKNVGLMLPVADCIATIVYDPTTQTLALLHLGRHSTMTRLLPRLLNKMIDDGSRPEDIIVWMSPSAQKTSYQMQYFDCATDPSWVDYCQPNDDGYLLDMQGYNANVCQECGVLADNIYISSIDTVTDPNYFSHSAGDTSGRFAVVAMMR